MRLDIKFVLLLSLLGFSCFAQKDSDNSEISLDGNWEIVFDHNNEGRDLEWFLDSKFQKNVSKRDIKVPSSWELIEQDYEGVAFYRYSFSIPENWSDKVIRLQFDAVNYLSEVWVNDEVVGFHEGGFTPFEFRVDEMIKPGEVNVITMRVVGPIILSDKEIDGVKALETPQWRGGISGGIWQSVKLVETEAIFVEDVFVQPNISNNTAMINLELNNTGIKGEDVGIEISIVENDNPLKEVARIKEFKKSHPGINNYQFKINIPEAIYWSPDHPKLYSAVIKIKGKNFEFDSSTVQFGMKEFTIKNKDFYLNGERIYVKATFFEGLYPNRIAFPDSKEMIRKEIQLAKDAGFNMIRPWRRPPVPMWLDLADEMGVLVVGSPALECMRLPLSTPYLSKRVENEIRNSILRDRNRACIVQWELFNELHRPVLKQLMRPMAMLARSLDPTRLILDESGGWANGANMYLPQDYEPTKFNDIHNYPGPFINEQVYDGFLSIGLTKKEMTEIGFNGVTPGRNVVPGLMSFVSELGYGSLPNLTQVNKQFKEEGNPLTPSYRYHKRLDEEQKQMLQLAGFSDLYPDVEQFYLDQQLIHGTANKRMIEAVRMNPEVDGYCIHALSAGDWILGAGLIDIWRNPKSYAYEGTKAANQPRIISIRAKHRNVYANKGMNLEILGANELEALDGKLEIEIKSSKKEIVYNEKVPFNWKTGVSSILNSKINTDNWSGKYIIEAKVKSNSSTIVTKNSIEFDVFSDNDLIAPKQKIAVIGSHDKFEKFINNTEMEVVKFNPYIDYKIPVFVVNNSAEVNNKKINADIIDFTKKGGTVVYIEGFQKRTNEKIEKSPFKLMVHPAVGLWTGISHLIHEHPIFNGLPSNGMMRNTYENVWPELTLRDLEINGSQNIEPIVASIGFDWFSEGHKMHYSGPGASWWGTDLGVCKLGKGKIIISQFRLLSNLGNDPVADKLFYNLIEFSSVK